MKGGQTGFPTFQVPRQCSLFFLVDILLKEGKDLGSEGGKVLGSGFGYKQRRKWSRPFSAYGQNCDTN
jgi:hypothetical protein